MGFRTLGLIGFEALGCSLSFPWVEWFEGLESQECMEHVNKAMLIPCLLCHFRCRRQFVGLSGNLCEGAKPAQEFAATESARKLEAGLPTDVPRLG